MNTQPSRNARRIFAPGLLAATFVFSAMVSTVYAQSNASRAAPEVAIGGITLEQRATRLITLSAQLVAEMPQGTTDNPVRLKLTQADRAELAAPAVSGEPLLIGVVKTLPRGIGAIGGQGFHRGVLQRTTDSDLVWVVTVTSPGARAIRVHVEKFSLPPGAEMYFFSRNGGADGPYVGLGRNGDGDFWTHSVPSDTGFILLRFPEADRKDVSFLITEVGHIQGSASSQAESEDPWPCADNVDCLIDANCESGTPADGAKSAVAKMEWIKGPYIYTCTGGLLADTDPSTQVPYFLTANHCLDKDNSNLETFFFYTTDSCNGLCPNNYFTGGAPPPHTIGVTVQATGTGADFTLLTLNQDPPAGATFLGWNNSPVAFTDNAPLYRISNANFGPQVYSLHAVDTTTPICTSLPRGDFIYSTNQSGSTMGGSSGSPVLNAAGEVVGQLYGCCGYNCEDDCDFATNWTIDGALASYWEQVADYLDPDIGCTSDAECDDGAYCNGAETCVANTCQPGTDPCDDGVGCTDDSCNEGTDSCDNIPDNGLCDDGQYCNGTEWCDEINDCQPGTDVDCNDGVGCTADSCNEGTDSCDNIPDNGLCDDGQYCNGAETCEPQTGDPQTGCLAATAPDCNDGVSCTDDSCNEGTDSCDNIPDNGLCDDGLYCNGAETCDAALDCQAGSDPCPGQLCDEGSDTCYDCLSNTDCDDGLYCNGVETCVGGTCLAGTPVTCDDGVSCTADSCNEGTDSCDNIPDNGLCDDGLFCDGAETCDPVNDCQTGTAPNCDDGTGCTVDSCNEGTDSCDHVPNHAACDNGLFCDGAETCDPVNDCQTGTAPNCDDGTGCTVDSCNTATDQCDHVPNDAACDNGLFCDGAETCEPQTGDPLTGCLAGTAPDCNDGVSCTDDSCNQGTDSCDNIPDNGLCDDDNACTSDTCDAGTGCHYAPVTCDDGDLCTTDGCDPAVGCTFDPVVCSDGDSCTTDTCDPGTGSCTYQPIVPCCGNGSCEGGEDSCLCSADCGAPPATELACSDGVDEDCDSFVDCDDSDCQGDPACPSTVCGDGVCEGGEETCFTCKKDCRCTGKNCSKDCCGDGICSGGESPSKCAVDCG